MGFHLVRLRGRELAFGVGKLPFGLIQRRLKGSRVDLEKQLALLYERAFLIGLSQQITGYLGLDLRVDQPLERADPFLPNRHIPLLYLDHHHLRRRRLGLLGLPAAKPKKRNRTRQHRARRTRV